MYIYVKLLLRDLNLDFCSPHPTNTHCSKNVNVETNGVLVYFIVILHYII